MIFTLLKPWTLSPSFILLSIVLIWYLELSLILFELLVAIMRRVPKSLGICLFYFLFWWLILLKKIEQYKLLFCISNLMLRNNKWSSKLDKVFTAINSRGNCSKELSLHEMRKFGSLQTIFDHISFLDLVLKLSLGFWFHVAFCN